MTNSLFWLIAIHCLCDFPLQNDFLARAKNHKKTLEGVPWAIALGAHAMIHAGGVALILPVKLAITEFFLHMTIDYAKNNGSFGIGSMSFTIDQVLHVMCKLIYVWVFTSSL